MDDLDRVFHRLVSNIKKNHPEYLTVPFTVQELYETLIPYRHHRRELGIETNQDYEVAVGRLLSGERDYLQIGQEMRDKLQAELTSPNVDTGAFREFAGSQVSLAPEALRRIGSRPASGGGRGRRTHPRRVNRPGGRAGWSRRNQQPLHLVHRHLERRERFKPRLLLQVRAKGPQPPGRPQTRRPRSRFL